MIRRLFYRVIDSRCRAAHEALPAAGCFGYKHVYPFGEFKPAVEQEIMPQTWRRPMHR